MRGQLVSIGITIATLLAADVAIRVCTAQKPGNGPAIVSAKEFRLVDAKGNMRAHLYLDKAGQSGLELFDRKGKVRVSVDTEEGRPGIYLFDSKERRRASLEIGLEGEPGFWFDDQNGTDRMTLGFDDTHSSAFWLCDTEGKDRGILGFDVNGLPGVWLYDKKRQCTWSTR